MYVGPDGKYHLPGSYVHFEGTFAEGACWLRTTAVQRPAHPLFRGASNPVLGEYIQKMLDIDKPNLVVWKNTKLTARAW